MIISLGQNSLYHTLRVFYVMSYDVRGHRSTGTKPDFVLALRLFHWH